MTDTTLEAPRLITTSASQPGTGVAVFPPVQTLVTAGDDWHKTQTFEVWTPWLAVFLFRNHPSIFAINGPLRSEDDRLYGFPFPHLGVGGNCCWGGAHGAAAQWITSKDVLATCGSVLNALLGSNNRYWYGNYFPAEYGGGSRPTQTPSLMSEVDPVLRYFKWWQKQSRVQVEAWTLMSLTTVGGWLGRYRLHGSVLTFEWDTDDD